MDMVVPQVDELQVPPTRPHTATVIFLHGLGQSNLTWRIVIAEAFARYLPHVAWILPQARSRPVALNQDQRRPSWFNISRLPPNLEEYDENGVATSVRSIENIILSQVYSGIDPGRIVLVGFSQGAALGMMVALTTLHELGGVASLSGWIPRHSRDQMVYTQPSLPLFWGHGAADEEVPLELAHEAISFLHRALVVPGNLEFRIYDGMGHSINDDEIEDLLLWLIEVLK